MMMIFGKQFFFLMILASVTGVLVNLVGLVHPEYISTVESKDFGFAVVNPSVAWFLCALLFLTVFCIPCLTVASANLCKCCWDSSGNKNKRKWMDQSASEGSLNQQERNILENATQKQLAKASKSEKEEDTGTMKDDNDDFIIEICQQTTSKTPPPPRHKKSPKEKKK